MSAASGRDRFAQLSESRRIVALLALVVAGESVFFLPFVLPRVFRPTILQVFGLTNYELGTAFFVYGLVGMAAYAVGGPLADLFCPRKLLATALVSTAVGAIVLWRIPALATLKWLYGYWGFTTIALFWAALIRATREWGGRFQQGAAFGLLDGGRGLLTALTGSAVVALYASLLPDDVESASLEVRAGALRQVILILGMFTFCAAIAVWLALPRDGPEQGEFSTLSLRGTRDAACMPIVWLQALIIICAYVGFKATDDFSLYAHDVLRVNEVEAARAGTYSLWIRPIAAVGAGLLADRFGAGRMTVLSFLLLIVGSGLLAGDFWSTAAYVPLLLTIVCASLGIFALRGLYYAVMEEGRVPLAYTGSAVGLVSVIGYTPDVFMGPLMGVLLDRSPGAPGHQHVFLLVMGFAIVGLVASVAFVALTKQKSQPSPRRS